MIGKLTTAMVVAGVLVVACGARGQDAWKQYQELYGEEAKKVRASGDPKAATALAARLLEEARGMPDLREPLLQKAQEFGMKDISGYPTAIEALERQAELPGAKEGQREEELLGSYRQWHEKAAGDGKRVVAWMFAARLTVAAQGRVEQGRLGEAIAMYREAEKAAAGLGPDAAAAVEAMRREAQAREPAERRLADLAARLKGNPGDAAAAKAAVALCLAELDSPQRALPFLEATGDAELQVAGWVAAGPAEAPDTTLLVRAGDVYNRLAGEAAGARRTAMKRKALGYYERFLAGEEGAVLAKARARKGVEEIRAELAQAAPPSRPATRETHGPPGSVVFLVDSSGSVLPCFDEIVKELNASIRRLQPGQNFEVMFFYKDRYVRHRGALSPATEENKRLALAFVGNARAAGWGSSPIPGMAAAIFAFAQQPDAGRCVLRVMTDGDFETSGYRYRELAGNEAVQSWLREHNLGRQVQVDVTIFGDRPTRETEESMRKIVAENGGEYRYLESKR